MKKRISDCAAPITTLQRPQYCYSSDFMINKIFFQDKTICTSPNLSIASVVDAVDALHVAGQRPVESRHPQLLP